MLMADRSVARFHRCAAVFKPVVPLLNLRDANSIVTENRVNLPNGFHLAVAQFQAKFDALALLQSFRHFPCNENRREHYTLPHSNAACQQLCQSTLINLFHFCSVNLIV